MGLEVTGAEGVGFQQSRTRGPTPQGFRCMRAGCVYAACFSASTKRLVPKSPRLTLLTGFRGNTGRICLPYTSFIRAAVPS